MENIPNPVGSARESLTGKYDVASMQQKFKDVLGSGKVEATLLEQALNRDGVVDLEQLADFPFDTYSPEECQMISSLLSEVLFTPNEDDKKVAAKKFADYIKTVG